MSDLDFLRRQALQLRQLLEVAEDDPIMQPQLKARLDDAERNLAEAEQQAGSLIQKATFSLPRAAIFLKGGGVQGSVGIRPALAGQALIQYEAMFVEQALHEEREAARSAGRTRRSPGAPKPALLFTGTPRGSFGLEFVPQPAEEAPSAEMYARALHNVADALVLVAENDSDQLGETIGKIPHGVIPYLKRFFTVLSEHGAELRLAFSDKPARALKPDRIKKAAERLEREVKIEEIEALGTFRGLTRESGYFDLRTTDGALITGVVAEGLTEEDIERIDNLTNKAVKAVLERTTVTKITGAVSYTFVLLNAEPLPPADLATTDATSH